MRTYTTLLVQVCVLLGAPLTAAQAADYGNSGPHTQGTAIEMPAAGRAERTDAAPSAARPPQTPPRGMHKDRVVAAYGAPETRHAAVGQPPISRWDYPDYRLYFEYNHVLHAVVPGDPEPVAHADQLQKTRP